MSTLKLQERFTLESAPELVWEYLTDPIRTVRCLPGAEITGQEDERTYSGAVKVKLGSVTIAYRGKVVFEEVDQERWYVRVVGKGREKTGSGSAEMTMESRVTALEGGGTEVTVDSEVRLTGKIVRFGRGMIDTVSAEIFKEFRRRLAEELLAHSAEPTGAVGGAPDGTSAGVGVGPESSEAGVGAGSESVDASVGGESERADAPAGGAPGSRGTTESGGGVAASDNAIPLIPLLFRAFRSWLSSLFKRS